MLINLAFEQSQATQLSPQSRSPSRSSSRSPSRSSSRALQERAPATPALQMVAEIRAVRGRRLPIIAYSTEQGMIDMRAMRSFEAATIDDCLREPYTLQTLAGKLRRYLPPLQHGALDGRARHTGPPSRNYGDERTTAAAAAERSAQRGNCGGSGSAGGEASRNGSASPHVWGPALPTLTSDPALAGFPASRPQSAAATSPRRSLSPTGGCAPSRPSSASSPISSKKTPSLWLPQHNGAGRHRRDSELQQADMTPIDLDAPVSTSPRSLLNGSAFLPLSAMRCHCLRERSLRKGGWVGGKSSRTRSARLQSGALV